MAKRSRKDRRRKERAAWATRSGVAQATAREKADKARVPLVVRKLYAAASWANPQKPAFLSPVFGEPSFIKERLPKLLSPKKRVRSSGSRKGRATAGKFRSARAPEFDKPRREKRQAREPRDRFDVIERKPRESRKAREDAPHCKDRPERSHGSGGSRAFVPWCDRKK